MPRVSRSIVLGFDDDTRQVIRLGLLQAGASSVVACSDSATAKAQLSCGLDLAVVDLRAGASDNAAFVEQLTNGRRRPTVVVIIDHVSSELLGWLLEARVDGLLVSPRDPEAIRERFRSRSQGEHLLDTVVRGRVGVEDLINVLRRVRETMVSHSLALTGGNRARAARLLGVHRTYLSKYAAKPCRALRLDQPL